MRIKSAAQATISLEIRPPAIIPGRGAVVLRSDDSIRVRARAGARNVVRILSFAKAFRTDIRKINDLVLTVDQEVGGSNPPGRTKHFGQGAWKV
jgi:hypothetical protein